MKHLESTGHQDYLALNEQDIIIMDNIRDLPENSTYTTEHVLVMICTTGKIHFDYDGQLTTVHNGELFLGVPGSVLSDYMVSPGFVCKLLAVKPTEVMASRELHTMVINSLLYIKTHPVAHLTESDAEDVSAYYDLISRRIRQAEHRYQNGEVCSLINAFLLRVVGIMDSGLDAMETVSSVHGDQLVERFVWMVNEDCGRNRYVEYYADRLNITPKYLSTLVRNTLGRTPSDVIKVVTTKEIERRLRYSTDSIKQISVAMNFPNTSFFGKYFKQHSGMTPNNYRKKYHK
ncbi:MAG: helix-turn-helix domain-containing protein [Prevotella sp.]|nr:helix-turn-helix domain-containing protein [Prevotella sp.]